MGLANEFALRQAQQTGEEFSLEREFLRRYPGLCIQCGFRICICPSVPQATVGRMSKELDIEFGENLFITDPEVFMSRGEMAASSILSQVGGYSSLVDRFPADRGDANRALIVLCLKLAQAVEGTRPKVSEHFRGLALSLGMTTAEAGSAGRRISNEVIQELLSALREAWREVGTSVEDGPPLDADSLALDLAKSISKLRVLFVYASPKDEESLHLGGELRTIREAIQLSGRAADVELDDLPAATVDDLRRALLRKEYEILHFSGHADDTTMILENPEGDSAEVPIIELIELFKRYPSVKCLILSACESASKISKAIAPFTIGMTDVVDDEAAIEFARGFYDALLQGKDIEFSVEEGKSAAGLKSKGPLPLKLLKM